MVGCTGGIQVIKKKKRGKRKGKESRREKGEIVGTYIILNKGKEWCGRVYFGQPPLFG